MLEPLNILYIYIDYVLSYIQRTLLFLVSFIKKKSYEKPVLFVTFYTLL